MVVKDGEIRVSEYCGDCNSWHMIPSLRMPEFKAAEGEDQRILDAWVDKESRFPRLWPVALTTRQPIVMVPDGMGEEVADDVIHLIAHTSQSGGIILDLSDPLLVAGLICNLISLAHDIWPALFSAENEKFGV